MIDTGLVIASTGLSMRRSDTITSMHLNTYAELVVALLQPRYGYCTATFWGGWDSAWGRALMVANIPYTLVLPCPAIGGQWHRSDREELRVLTSQADDVVHMADSYKEGVYGERDRYLVHHAEAVITLTRPSKQCRVYEYAMELGVPAIELWDHYNGLYHPTKWGRPFTQ